MLDSALYYTDMQLKTAILRLDEVQAVLSPPPPTPPDNPDGTPAEAPKRKLMLDVSAPEAQPFLVDENNIQRAAKQYPSDITRKISLFQRLQDQRGLVESLKPLMNVEEIFNKYGVILVNAYIETREYASARDLINRLLEKNPSDCDLHKLNAYIDLKQERYGAAIQVLLEGVKACPKDQELWGYLGDSYYFSNEKDRATVEKAKDAYKRACGLGSATSCEKADQITEILAQWR
jgi:tetratricopeptide (TPR) repeat protein